MDWNYLFTRFEGRISRQPFWIATLIFWAVNWGLAGISYAIFGEYAANIVILVVPLVLLYPALAVGIKRWHDRDKSGWWMLIVLVPVVGPFWYLIECGFLRGTAGENRFGPDPLGGA